MFWSNRPEGFVLLVHLGIKLRGVSHLWTPVNIGCGGTRVVIYPCFLVDLGRCKKLLNGIFVLTEIC